MCVLAVAALLTTACGRPGTAPAFHEVAAPGGSPTAATDPADVTPAPSVTGTATKPPGQPAPTSTPRRTTTTGGPIRVSFSHPLPFVEPNPPPYTGIFQDNCGWPNRAIITISLADSERRGTPEFDYHVQTPEPFQGTVTGLTMNNGGAIWSHLIGPFPAKSANRAGGTIAVTVRVKYPDGSVRTATGSTPFKPCTQ